MKLFVLRNEAIARRCLEHIKAEWWAAAEAGKPLAIEISPEKAKRSREANRRYWVLLRQISENFWVEGKNYDAECWHEAAKRKFLGVDDIPTGGTLAKSSSKLNTAQFYQYTQQVEAWAASELGVQFIEEGD